YSGKAFISANVSSKAPFKAYASVDGVPVSFSNGTILVNTSHFPNGTNTLTINAVNGEGNEITSSFKVAFDNYVVRIGTNFVNGSSIPEGKNLNFSIGGVPNCTSTLQVQSFRYVFNSLSFTVKLPQNLNGTIQINVVVSDPLGRQFSRTYDLEILNNPFPNDFIYPINGSYFDTGRIHLSWGSEPNASLYRLVFNSSSGGAFSIQTGQNSTFANLTNGLWNIELMVTQDDNVTSSVGNLTVGVITYKPYLELYYNGPRNLSFFGNSNRTDAVVSIVTNITCYLNLSIIGPEGEVFHYESAGDFSNISLASLMEDFTRNGEYEILATAQTESGTFSEKNISFSVNNTIPGSIGIPTTYYTNSDTFTLLLPHSWNYSLKIANARNLNGSKAILKNDSVLINFTANLSTAEIEVLYTDSWGNHNSTWINITHSTIRPYIVLSTDSIFLDKANETYLEYNVTDPERLGNISLLLDGKFYRNLSRDGGSVNISFKSNGNYSFRIFAADICGNTNYSPILNMTVDYYVKVSSVEIDAFMVLGFAYFHVIISGNNTNVLNVTVLSGGREVHSGASYFTILMPGFHTITFRISGNNYRSTITRDYFTVGFLPLLMPAGFVIYIVTRRRANIGKGRHIIVETILRNNGRSVDEIADLITEFKVTKRVLLKIARSMQRDGILELRTDLDGEFYVFTKESH
ncbi:MAG TPA: hypothetical protein VKU79_05035, partial [Thermoplasmataceae archaeon]|nr:hypothetical protein [Thermoplasmataceae archaeon]